MAYNTRLRLLTTPGGGEGEFYYRIFTPLILPLKQNAGAPSCRLQPLKLVVVTRDGSLGLDFWKGKVFVIIIPLIGLVLLSPVTGYLRIWPYCVILGGGFGVLNDVLSQEKREIKPGRAPKQELGDTTDWEQWLCRHLSASLRLHKQPPVPKRSQTPHMAQPGPPMPHFLNRHHALHLHICK